jgi:hypothetical protein
MATAQSHSFVDWRLLDDPDGYRIVALNPGEGDEPLTCELLEQTFETAKEEYVAISYAWGTTELDHHIICRDCPVPITANLYSALRRIRQPSTVLHVWCDALCIRQGHDPASLLERGHQITLMSRIFSSAARVVVDLGDDDGTFEQAVVGINTILNVYQGLRDQVDLQRNPLEYLGLPDSTHPMWSALRALFMRPWFFRLWSVNYPVAKSSST